MSTLSPGGLPLDAPVGVPDVTVAIPTYERRDLVVRAVESVLAQSVTSFEVIVVDGGNDGTEEALTGIDSRVRYEWMENRGPGPARNRAIQLARSDVIAFLDSDDRWLPQHLEVVLGALRRHPQAVLACTSPRFRNWGSEPPEQAELVDSLPRGLVASPVGWTPCVAARRDALLAVGGFDERLLVGEDTDLWKRLALVGPFSFVNHRTFLRAQTPGGLSSQGTNNSEYLRTSAMSAVRIVDEVQALPPERSRDLIRPARAAMHLSLAINALDARDTATAQRELAEACRLLPDLSTRPNLSVWRFRRIGSTAPEQAAGLEIAARVWPSRRARTALRLRTIAVRLAIQNRQLGRALRLASYPPLYLTPSGVRTLTTVSYYTAKAAVERRRAVRVGDEPSPRWMEAS